jgi:hypothetical protein
MLRIHLLKNDNVYERKEDIKSKRQTNVLQL